MEFYCAVILCARLCIAQQNLSIGVNVVGLGCPLFRQSLLRCPTSACVAGAPWHLSTAATRSGRFLCRRQCSHRSPVAFIYLSPFFTNNIVGRGLAPAVWCVLVCGGSKPPPYNNFTNYAVSICKLTEIIPPQIKMNLSFLLQR